MKVKNKDYHGENEVTRHTNSCVATSMNKIHHQIKWSFLVLNILINSTERFAANYNKLLSKHFFTQ